MISRVNLKTLIENSFTLKSKDDINRKQWFNRTLNLSYRDGAWTIMEE